MPGGIFIEPRTLTSRPIDPLRASANVFHTATLEHSFQLLRHCQPSLALLVQNQWAAAADSAPGEYGDNRVTLHLPVDDVSRIITALSQIAEDAAADGGASREHRESIHHTLLTWLIYAQSFLEDSACGDSD